MIDRRPRLLFVPVSSPFGRGEYARSLAIAKGAEARWPEASIQFMLSRDAPYADRTAFPATLLPSSPTFHSAAVIEVIERWRPDVVIFDNAGRSAQLRAAKRSGARVVYISARRRQRRKAFRLRWMRLIDEHWIAYPKFIAGGLSHLERLKLDWLRRPAVRYLDVILDAPRGGSRQSTASRDGAADAGGAPAGQASECRGPLPQAAADFNDFVLVVPGGGASHPGAADAVGQFRLAARGLADSGVNVVFVARQPAVSPDPASRLRSPGTLSQPELAELMRAARLVIANGGSTLVQSIACGRPCIAVPIAGDQEERIRRCVSARVAVAAPRDPQAIVRAATRLLGNESELEAMAARAVALGLADGVEVALRAMSALIAADPR